jgi:hypothetical protein
MRALRLISTTAAILLLGAGAVSAQGMKNDETTAAPAAQQNAPPEKMAPAAKSDPIKAPEKSGQAVPAAPTSSNNQQTTDKGAPASPTAKDAMAKDSSDANGNADVKSKRTARHYGGRYAGYRHGPLYDSYRGDRGYRGCHHHRLMPWLWC